MTNSRIKRAYAIDKDCPVFLWVGPFIEPNDDNTKLTHGLSLFQRRYINSINYPHIKI